MEKELAGEKPSSGQSAGPEVRVDGELDENDLESVNGGSIQEEAQRFYQMMKAAADKLKATGDAFKTMAGKG